MLLNFINLYDFSNLDDLPSLIWYSIPIKHNYQINKISAGTITLQLIKFERTTWFKVLN